MSNNNRPIVDIRDLGNYVNRKVNILGAVLEFSLPRKSQGTDYVSTLRIVDESQQSPELSVLIFTQTIDHLPHIRSYKDLILLKNVLIKMYDGQVSAVFYKNSSSFALFDGTSSTDIVEYQSSPRFFLIDSEKDFIRCIRQWCADVEFTSGSSEYLLSLKSISENTYFDLVCKVVHVSYEASKHLWILFVWDGTDAPPLNLHGKLEDEELNPLPLQIESAPTDKDILCKFQTIGTVLRVTADQAHENVGLHFTAVGKWVKIRDITCKVSSGMWHGFLKSSSRIRFLSCDDNIVQDCRRRYNDRILEENGCLPQWSKLSSHFLTVIDLKDITFVTLMDILTHAKVNARLCCIVRVVAIHRSQADDFTSPYSSSECGMRLTLEDPTARIHAFLCGEEWVKFFDGFSIEEITSKLKILAGVLEHQNAEDDGDIWRSPPWIQCCILVKMSNDGTNNRGYYICCTRLLAG